MRGFRRQVSPYVPSFPDQRRGDEAETTRRQLTKLPLQDRAEVEMDFTATAATTVQHNLGRKPTGWLVVDIDAGLTLYRRAADAWDKHSVTLYNASASTGTATVWVF